MSVFEKPETLFIFIWLLILLVAGLMTSYLAIRRVFKKK